MTYAELVAAVERMDAVKTSHTSPILSTTLKLASRYQYTENHDVSELLLQSLIYACRDLNTAYQALTEMKMRHADPVTIFPSGERGRIPPEAGRSEG